MAAFKVGRLACSNLSHATTNSTKLCALMLDSVWTMANRHKAIVHRRQHSHCDHKYQYSVDSHEVFKKLEISRTIYGSTMQRDEKIIRIETAKQMKVSKGGSARMARQTDV
eukprot:3706145-Pleurochrysis_carterae.AAC.1